MNKMGPRSNVDGLILAYDAKDSFNSYKGTPVTNLANNLSGMGPANSYIPVNTTAHSSIVQVSTDVVQPPVPGLTVWKIYDSNPDGYSRFGIGQNGSVTIASFGTYDVTYVASIYVYIPSGVQLSGATACWATQNSTGIDWHTGNYSTANPSYGYYSADINTLSSEANLSIRDKWQRLFVRFTTSSTVRAYGGADNCKYLTVQFRPNLVGQNGSSFIYVSGFQLEQGSFPSQFAFSSRSNTTGLLNLTGTSNIDLTYMGYNDNKELYFNGSSNYITTGFTRGTLADNFSIIGYCKYTGTAGRTYSAVFGGKEAGTEFFIGKNSGNTNIGIQDGNYDGAFVVGSNAFDGNWHQWVYTYGGSTGRFYLDGSLKNTGTFTKCNDAEEIIIGGESESGGYYWDGYIDKVFIYKRTLTESDVYDNFIQFRKRYGI
jgi:hypothetical protein